MAVSGQLSIEELGAWAGFAAQFQDVDWTGALKVTSGLIRSDAAKNFQEGHGPDGRLWPPVSGLTAGARRNASEGGGAKPLLDTGILRASVLSQSGKGHVEEVTRRQLIFGTNLDYAGQHQQGFSPNPQGMTITATNAKALAIPLTTEARLAGSPLKFGKPLKFIRPAPGKVGNVRGYFVEVVGESDLAKIAKKEGQGKGRRGTGGAAFKLSPVSKENEKNYIFHYLLKRSVKIPQRQFLGLGPELLHRIQQAFSEFYLRLLGTGKT